MTRRLMVALMVIGSFACVGRPSDDATGEEIYIQLCSNCHGADLGGGLGPAMGSASNSAELPDEFLRVTINEGRGRMPSFASSLDEDQLERLVQYIRVEQGQ